MKKDSFSTTTGTHRIKIFQPEASKPIAFKRRLFEKKPATKENSLDFTCHRNRHGSRWNNCFQQYFFPGVELYNRHRCIRRFSRDCNRFSQYRFFCRLIQQQTAGCQNRNIESTHIFSTAECVCFKNAASTYSENCTLTGIVSPILSLKMES